MLLNSNLRTKSICNFQKKTLLSTLRRHLNFGEAPNWKKPKVISEQSSNNLRSYPPNLKDEDSKSSSSLSREQSRVHRRKMVHAKLEDVTGLKEDLIGSAWSAAVKAHKYPEKPFLLEKTRDFFIISFAGSWSPEGWFSSAASGSSFGETKLDRQLFPSIRSIGVDESAEVNSAFFQRFEGILGKLKEVLRVNKPVVFTGHSAGGPVAILATIWLLEQQRNPNSNSSTASTPPKCITFGSPLVGNFIFSHALKREKWSIHFIHFITKYDIVPRIHLAPLQSLQPQLQPILNSLNSRSLGSASNANAAGIATTFFTIVMRNASAVASNAACRLMGNTSLLLDTLKSFVKLSPYSPFGTYIFLTESEKVVVVTNPEAVLQMLFYSCQLNSESECEEIADRSLKAHWEYEAKMQHQNLEQLHAVRLDEFDKLPLSLSGRNTPITQALNELGLSTRALLNLRAAGAFEEQKMKNQERMEAKKQCIEEGLNWLEENYRAVCKVDGLGYYDAFKLQKDKKDFEANIKRLEQAGIWDEIVEMLKRYELPDEFEGNDEWIQLGTRFRRLVEPLDIANYYRHSKNDDTGPYMIKGRPKRYRFTQRWLEHHRKMTESSEESCLWAKIEELQIQTRTRMYAEYSGEIIELEKRMKRWVNEIEDDMLLKKSTFMEWWKTLPEHHRSQSCIKDDIERMENREDAINSM